MPTMVASAGIDFNTTALAPTTDSAPISLSPRTPAPAPRPTRAPMVRRRPVHAATAKAYRQVATARSGLDLWLDVRATPPMSLGDLLLESLLGAMADRPSSPSAPR